MIFLCHFASASDTTFHDPVIEHWHGKSFDPQDIDATFAHIFAELPPSVMVYPTENYVYWQCEVQAKDIWGNFCLSPNNRRNGQVGFGYFEHLDDPDLVPSKPLAMFKAFGVSEGIRMRNPDPFECEVTYEHKTVTFHLNRISQLSPRFLKLKGSEDFVERVFDESGVQFLLMFNHVDNYFFWVLDDDVDVPESFVSLGQNCVEGRRTGFIFWIDPWDHRRVLAAVRETSVRRNDYYDGPFDQLADNFAETSNLQRFLLLWQPELKDQIDIYGNFIHSRSLRVSLSCYGKYHSLEQVSEFIAAAEAAADPTREISALGDPSLKARTH